jgi:hypothetical protein
VENLLRAESFPCFPNANSVSLRRAAPRVHEKRSASGILEARCGERNSSGDFEAEGVMSENVRKCPILKFRLNYAAQLRLERTVAKSSSYPAEIEMWGFATSFELSAGDDT